MRHPSSRLVTVTVVLACALAVPAGAARAADWPQWRGERRDGVSTDAEALATWPPEQLWTAEVGIGYAGIAVRGDRAYAVGHARGVGEKGIDTVSCLDVGTGTVVWKHAYECTTTTRDKTGDYPGPRATPCVDGEVVYVVSLEGHLFCLDAATGAVRWFKALSTFAVDEGTLDYGYCASPLVCGETLVCYLNGAAMAFAKSDGKPLWRRKGGGGPWNVPSPVCVSPGGAAQVVIGEVALVGVNAADGTKAWEYNLGRAMTMTPVVVGERLFFATYPNKGHCGLLSLGGPEPKLLWQNRDLQVYHMGNPVVVGGHLYGIDSARTEFSYSDDKVSRLKCLDLATGAVAWEEKKVGWAQLVAAGESLLVARECGEIVLVKASPAAYAEVGRVRAVDGPMWALPALAGGRLYLRSNAGRVVCLRTAAK